MTITEEIERIVTHICDYYCKFPQIYREQYEHEDEAMDALTEDKCSQCPLERFGV